MYISIIITCIEISMVLGSIFRILGPGVVKKFLFLTAFSKNKGVHKFGVLHFPQNTVGVLHFPQNIVHENTIYIIHLNGKDEARSNQISVRSVWCY
jgi:hypothetical protein